MLPDCLVRVVVCCLVLLCVALCCGALCCPVSLAAVLRRVAPRCVVLLSAVLLCFARLVPLLAVSCPRVLSIVLGSCTLRRYVLWCFPRCVLCAVCVLSWCGGTCCCWLLCFVLRLCWGVLLRDPCPPRSERCCAALCWCACVVLFVRSALFLAPGAVVRCCVFSCCLWFAVARCWLWLSAVVFLWRVAVSVSLSGRAACFPVVAVVCCEPCSPVSCSVLLCCRLVLSCQLCCVFAVLFVLAVSFIFEKPTQNP